MIALIDYHKGTYSETFTLRIHSPPYLIQQLPLFFKIQVGTEYEYALPLAETDGISLFHSSIPTSFTNIENFIYYF